VFIVDDEPFIVEGLNDAVDWSALGLEVVGTAENGQKALQALSFTPADILITDISMPVMNGLELIPRARGYIPELKVIILSGYNEFKYLKEGMKLGIENYLLKPINLDELHETLRGTIDKINDEGMDRSLHSNDIGILKDNILYRWMMGRITPEELAERAAFLQIEMKKPCVLAAVLNTGSDPTRLFDAIEDQLRSESSWAISFRDMEDQTVIVFLLDDSSLGKRDALEALQKLIGDPNPDFARLRVSVGSVETVDRAYVSYSNAKKAEQYFIVFPDRVIVDYDRVVESQKSIGPLPELKWETYGKLIASKDTAALGMQIDKDFETVQATEGVDPARIKSAAVELIIRMKTESDKVNRPDQQDVYKSGLESVMNASSLSDIMEVVRETAERTVEVLIGDDKSPVIRQVLRHIQESYADALSLKSLAQQYHIHPVYLGHLFHKQTGDTFTDYINKYRIEKAKELLRESPMKVNEIARQVGYWEPGYFYKQFKKHVGISPSEYKGML
jgi:two-component system response regulator YesN